MIPTAPSASASHDPLARTAATRRVGLALAMLIAPWLTVLAETGHALITPQGQDDLDPAVALAVDAAHPGMQRWSALAGLLAALLFVPAILGVMRLVRTRAAWLGLVGGTLAAAGYICYFALLFQGAFTEAAMVKVGGSVSQNVEVLQSVMDGR